QGIVQGTFETFGACARQHFGGSLAGKLVVTAGCGGMGGAQPLAATMNGAVCLIADVDRERLERRVATRYLDEVAPDLDSAIQRAREHASKRRALSVGVVANAVDLLERLLQQGVTPDVLTDQTSAHDVMSYVPIGVTLNDAATLRERDARAYAEQSLGTMARHVRAMLQLRGRGAVTFDYGNNLRQRALERG